MGAVFSEVRDIAAVNHYCLDIVLKDFFSGFWDMMLEE
jgi:hypothetical protein